MARSPGSDAFRAESAALSAVAVGLSDAVLRLPSPCPPWSNADLLCHVVIAVGRVSDAIAAADSGPAGRLVPAAGYYRRDERFSAAVNADRIDVAASLAARIGAAAISAELAAVSARSLELIESAGPWQQVLTRHGDRMLLSEFVVTRVVELAVHGLDLAAGLARQPWLTNEAGDVLEALLLPDGNAGQLQGRLGCDRVGLIAGLTGRAELTAAETEMLAQHGLTALALG